MQPWFEEREAVSIRWPDLGPGRQQIRAPQDLVKVVKAIGRRRAMARAAGRAVLAIYRNPALCAASDG
jgi:hypothetical protein